MWSWGESRVDQFWRVWRICAGLGGCGCGCGCGWQSIAWRAVYAQKAVGAARLTPLHSETVIIPEMRARRSMTHAARCFLLLFDPTPTLQTATCRSMALCGRRLRDRVRRLMA